VLYSTLFIPVRGHRVYTPYYYSLCGVMGFIFHIIIPCTGSWCLYSTLLIPVRDHDCLFQPRPSLLTHSRSPLTHYYSGVWCKCLFLFLYVQLQACAAAGMYSCRHVQRQAGTAAGMCSGRQVQLQACAAAGMCSCRYVQLQACAAAGRYSCRHVQLQACTAAGMCRYLVVGTQLPSS